MPKDMIARYMPPAGKTLLIIGQDLGAVAGYVEHVWPTPGGVTTYTSISEGPESDMLHGLSSTGTYGSGDVNAKGIREFRQTTQGLDEEPVKEAEVEKKTAPTTNA